MGNQRALSEETRIFQIISKSLNRLVGIYRILILRQILEEKMPKFLIKYKVNPQMMPSDPKECVKLLQSMNEEIKSMIDSGKILDFGEYCDGSGGYTIGEGDDVTELYVSLMQWWPYVEFDAKPVLTIDQVIKSTKALAEMKGK